MGGNRETSLHQVAELLPAGASRHADPLSRNCQLAIQRTIAHFRDERRIARRVVVEPQEDDRGTRGGKQRLVPGPALQHGGCRYSNSDHRDDDSRICSAPFLQHPIRCVADHLIVDADDVPCTQEQGPGYHLRVDSGEGARDIQVYYRLASPVSGRQGPEPEWR